VQARVKRVWRQGPSGEFLTCFLAAVLRGSAAISTQGGISRAERKRHAAFECQHLAVASLVPIKPLVDELVYNEAYDGLVMVVDQTSF